LTPRSCFGPAWRSPLQVAISTIGNSAGLIGAGYMIVNELALTGAGYGANAHSRQPCGADLSSSRSPTRARGILVSPRLCREGINSDTQAFAEHKTISDGQDHRDRSGTRTHGSLTPDIGGVSKDFPRRPIFHKNKDLHPCVSMDRPKWCQNGVRPIAKLSKEAPINFGSPWPQYGRRSQLIPLACFSRSPSPDFKI
jgi:hypothetical protein